MEKSFLDSLNIALNQMVAYLPDFLAAIVILILGAIAGYIVKKLVFRIGILIRIDRLARRFFAKGDVRHTFLNVLGSIVGIVIFLVFLDNALIVLKLSALEKMVQAIVFFIPNLIISAVIFGVGLLVANRVANSTEELLQAEGLVHSYAISRFIRSGILLFVIAVALIQVGISKEIVFSGFVITFGSVGLAIVLAFGLGSKDQVQKLWDYILERRKKE